jgi:hypothetical protein
VAMIAQRELDALFALNQDVWRAVSADPGIPQTMKLMVYLHITKPWIPDYLSLAISPLREGLGEYLGRPVFHWAGMTFYYPSARWWQSHGERSHPPQGAGCDAGVHEQFLTAEGPDGEFVYAAVLKSGDIKVLDRGDFDAECAFWASGKG